MHVLLYTHTYIYLKHLSFLYGENTKNTKNPSSLFRIIHTFLFSIVIKQ